MKPNVLGMKLKNKINIKKIGTKKITIKRIRSNLIQKTNNWTTLNYGMTFQVPR